MFEKVNPMHPDKIADRIAGAIVDYAYSQQDNPKIAVEVLIGHGECRVICESSVDIPYDFVQAACDRITKEDVKVRLTVVPQDPHLADNQVSAIRCGDNGVFKGMPVTNEQKMLTEIAKNIYENYPYDGKYILDGDRVIICQSHTKTADLAKTYPVAIINPLGDWTGGTNVDTGATNRKLGSDMGDSVTGGGLCLSGDSEYLGEDNCWHYIKDYKEGKVAQWNGGNLEFVEPIRYIHNLEDDFIHIYNNSKLDMELTPYHNVLIKTSKNHLIKKPAYLIAEKLYKKIGNSGSIIHNFQYNRSSFTTSKYQDEADYRLQVAFCADGTILHNTKKWNGRIRVKKQYKKDRLRNLLAGKNYKETTDGEYSIFWYKFTKADKSLYNCFNNENWDILRDEIFKWDGSAKLNVFRTTKKEEADFIQIVLASFGDCVTITQGNRTGKKHIVNNKEYEKKSILYTVHRMKSTQTHLRISKGSPITVEYKQEKRPSYCFEVPSHNLIIRHNDKIFVTGNCGKDLSKADVSVNIYAWLKAQETNKEVNLCCAIGDEYIDGKPYSEIVNIAKDYIDGIGGFEKFAEWGLIR